VEDTAVAPEKLSEFIGKFLESSRLMEPRRACTRMRRWDACTCVGDQSQTENGVRTFESVANQVADLVLEYAELSLASTATGWCGVLHAQDVRRYAVRGVSRDQAHVDPLGILNPGKIVDAPPLTQNLRYGTSYKARNPQSTYFDYSEYGGFAEAVEMCSGVGACRKKLAGTMCPSYMATREESDTTRGRANTLRLAMSGQLNEAGLADEAVYKSLIYV